MILFTYPYVLQIKIRKVYSSLKKKYRYLKFQNKTFLLVVLSEIAKSLITASFGSFPSVSFHSGFQISR